VAATLVGLNLSTVAQDVPARGAEPVARDLSSYALIDDAFEWEYLIAPDAKWEYFPGREEPAPKLEWTARDFRGSDWELGRAPFGFGEGAFGTTVDAMREEGLSTLYVRHVITVPDPLLYRWVRIEIAVDDGYVCYLNKLDEGRSSAGPKSDVRMDFDAQASSRKTIERRPVSGIDFTDKLKTGENAVAIQGLNFEGEETFALAPQMRGWFRVDPERDRARVDELMHSLKGEANAARRAYLEGCYHQRVGEPANAASFFAEAVALDPLSPEPWDRFRACHREAGSVAQLEEKLRGEIRGGNSSQLLLDTWTQAFLEDLRRTPADLVAAFPDVTVPDHGLFSDAHHAGSTLAAGEALQIDCGSESDRFYLAGEAEVRNGDGSTLVRAARRELSNFAPFYRVPVPPGAYAVKVNYIAAGPFELVVEGARIPGHADGNAPALIVHDGFLDIDLIPGSKDDVPAFESLELWPIETDALKEMSELRIHANPELSFGHVQLGEVEFAAGDVRGAIARLEHAATLPDFSHTARERLATFRDALLPDIASIATVDDFVVRRADEAESILAGFMGVAEDDEALARAVYMEGRILQLAGDFDGAIGFYEELVFGGAPYPEPYIGMAECLRGVQLPDEASEILRGAVADGVPPSADLVHLLLTLQIDDLKVDPWGMVAELREMDLPDTLTIIPTSQYDAQPWEYSIKEPAATTWSRPTWDTSLWDRGLGGMGSGSPPGGLPRIHWYETKTIFSRRTVNLRARPVLYPYYLASLDGGDIYLNGIQSERIPNPTYGYIRLPQRDGTFANGENILGIYGFNSKDDGFLDVGVVTPLGELEWILTTLETDGALRIDCAGESEYTDQEGRSWSTDRFFSGYGKRLVLDGGPPEIAGTTEPELYQSQKLYTVRLDENDNWYNVPVPDGTYQVSLHFAEIDPEITAAGQRIFGVKLEKQDVIKEYDIFASVGFATADVQTFDVNVTDGWLDIDLTRLVIEEKGRGGVEKHKGDPIIAAIEIMKR